MASSLDTAWSDLRAAHEQIRGTRIADLFRRDARRFEHLSFRLDDLLVDFSKCKWDENVLGKLVALAEAADVVTKREAMFSGEAINVTENRAVLHVALRADDDAVIRVAGADVMPDVRRVRAACLEFARGIRAGTIKGKSGRFTDIVNIGIGGSDLGPAMATLALAPVHDGPRAHFVSNVDAAHLADTLKNLNPATTLLIVASKTFTTIETMTNAHSARAWIVEALGEAAVADHFAAVSTALPKVAAFGIRADRTFGFWDWVGGRYSIWSSIGLPLAIAIGSENFLRFLEGARSMDKHFREAPLGENLPVLLALAGIWHRDICLYPTRVIIPYDQRLARFPAYLQQLDMESNGKSVTKDGRPVPVPTGPIVWGEPGTNGQHAFFQLLHQGTDIVPVEFILGARSETRFPHLRKHHDLLVANCLAQSQALMLGRTLEEAGGNPHRVFPGDRPSITILHEALTPHALGRLIALYEHRVFVEAEILGINAFDQWGVELGKELALSLAEPVETGEGLDTLDGSTAGLVRAVRKRSAPSGG